MTKGSFWALYLAWLIALAGTLLSLFYSEIKDFEPCLLCRLQRVCLFPLAIQLGVAVYRTDSAFAFYGMPLSILGAFIALLQILEPWLGLSRLCGLGPGCAENLPLAFGLIPLTWLSLTGFTVMSFLIWQSRRIDFRKN